MTSFSWLLFFFCLSSIRIDIWAFRCDSGKIIADFQFCNKKPDCGAPGDRSDEQYGCDKKLCGKGNFKCQTERTCVEIAARCNGINDCADESDELNCGTQPEVQINPEDCRLDQGKFLCKDKLACIDFALTCDNRFHCRDHSDESDSNCGKLDSESCSSCTQYCLPTPDGPTCICNSSNYELSPLCKEIQNCTGSREFNCDQHCTQYKNFARCLCYEGHHEIQGTDGKIICRNNLWFNTVLLYSTVTRVRSFNFTNEEVRTIQWSTQCTALAASRGQVYWAEYRDEKSIIRRASIYGGPVYDEIINLDSRITSVSVDWVTENVYFTNNDTSLYVCNRRGGICTELNCCGINNVVLVPKQGIMFFSQTVMSAETDQFIMKSNMDGSEEDSLLLDESFIFPVSLAIDEYEEKLYWLEVKERKLHSASFDGYKRQVIELGLSAGEIYSYFSVLEKNFFFVGGRSNSFHSKTTVLDPARGSEKAYQDASTSYVRNLYVHSPELQNTHQVENPCANATCAGLCLTRPSANSSDLSHTCVCEDFIPIDDNHWCDKNAEYSKQPSQSDVSSSDETSSSSSTPTQYETTGPTDSCSSCTTKSNESSSTSSTEGRLSATTVSTNTPDEVDVSPAPPIDPRLALFPESSQPLFDDESDWLKSLNPFSEAPSKEIDYVVVYSTATRIKTWYVTNNTRRVVQSGVDSTALVGVRGYVYYGSIDGRRSHIFKTDIESGHTKEILRLDTRITSIAVEWITNNVYFTSNGSLSVCSEDGGICTKLKICCGIDQVTVAPKFRWIFYAQKIISDNTHFIVRCGPDGAEETILIDESFTQIDSLTVDESSEKIYWREYKLAGSYWVHSVSFSGTGKDITFQLSKGFILNTHFGYTSFSIVENNFFHEFEDNGFTWRKASGEFHNYLDNDTNQVKFLHAFSPALQNVDKIKNPCQPSSCSGLCLLSPIFSKDTSSFTCVCEDFTPTYENHWCDMDHPVAEMKLTTSVRKIEPTTTTEPARSFPPRNAPRGSKYSENPSVIVTSMESLQHGYTIASGVGFLLGVATASLVIAGTCFVYQKFGWSKDRKRYLVNGGRDEIEL